MFFSGAGGARPRPRRRLPPSKHWHEVCWCSGQVLTEGYPAMANKDPSRTEKPTSKRLSEARRKGQVLMSNEVNSVVSMLGGTLLMFVTLPMLSAAFSDILRGIMEVDPRQNWNNADIFQGTVIGAQAVGFILLPFMVVLCLLAVVATWSQTGVYFETEPLEWKLDKLNPVNGAKQIIPSKDNLIKFGLTFSKVSIVAAFVYFAIRAELNEIVSLPMRPLSLGLEYIVWLIIRLVFKILALYLVVVVLDFFHRRQQYMDGLMMTKEEVKDERKNAEGNPQIKSKQRAKMMSMSMMRLVAEVPKADVVITNPTHVAVALRYRPGDFAPRVIAKGLRKRALRIKAMARDAGVPVIELPPLARALYRQCQVGGFIPMEFFGAVATVLAKLQQSGRRTFTTA